MSSTYRRAITVARRPADGAFRPSATLDGVMRHRLTRGQGPAQRVGPDRLDAVDADPRAALAQRDRHAAQEATAPDRDHHDVHVGQVLEDLEAAGPVAEQDLGVVVRVDEHQAALLAQPLEVLQRLPDVLPAEHHLRAVAQARGHLGGDGALGHDDRHRHARLARRPRVGLPRVSGRDGDRAPAPLLGRERGDPGERGARLEGPGLLEVLGLEVQPAVGEADAGCRPGHAACRRRGQQLRAMDPAVEDRPGGADRGEGDGHLAHDREYAARTCAASGPRQHTCVLAQSVRDCSP